MTTVYGIPVSPFVRKVLFVLEHNGIDYELDPVTPFDPPAGFRELSPLGKIPAYQDDEITLADSSIICAYLDSKYGQPAEKSVYPQDRINRARAQWFEEIGDTKLIELLGGGIFFERVVKPKFLNEPTDNELVEETINVTLPPVLDYLEAEVPEQGFLFGEDMMLADVSLAGPFLNAMYADYQLEAQRWPKLAGYVQRVLATPAYQTRITAEKAVMGG